ncbi:hypothetical protein RJ639_046182 [Escallonia herrerae]|uniref:Uncharacterized protein n=1 Tax=Escallonia herrerae TaxID=1293975 RepID=A0AA88WAI6_9ASTE|nr:hypothetical protein RJ639_046182 [Escallonia herrerae]
MVAVFNKELLSWYLITLKLKETVDAGITNIQSPTSSRSVELPNQSYQQKQQNQPYYPLQIAINAETSYNIEEGPKSPESEWVIIIRDKLEQARQDDVAGSWAKLCIYKIPQHLREGDDKVYVPQIFSSGPYHHGKKTCAAWTATSGDKHRQQLIHCVTELREAGIKFKKRKTDRFWDVKFKNGILRIPRLLIHDGTKSLFHNLIAFEQCHLDSSNEITSYVIFMDNLINSPEDVGYLHYCGIIEHWLGSDAEVADLFNPCVKRWFSTLTTSIYRGCQSR